MALQERYDSLLCSKKHAIALHQADINRWMRVKDWMIVSSKKSKLSRHSERSVSELSAYADSEKITSNKGSTSSREKAMIDGGLVVNSGVSGMKTQPICYL